LTTDIDDEQLPVYFTLFDRKNASGVPHLVVKNYYRSICSPDKFADVHNQTISYGYKKHEMQIERIDHSPV